MFTRAVAARGLRWLAVVSVALLSASGASAAKPPVTVNLSRDGFEIIAIERDVTVYKNEKTELIWIGAEGRVPAPPAEVERALLDYGRQVGKIGRLAEARVLARQDGELVVYQRLSLPVISDRDFTLQVKHGTEGLKRWISYWAISDQGPAPRDGVVRVSDHRGAWELLPVADGKETLLRFEVRIDLAGSVPKWMARSSAGEEIPELYGAVCRLAAVASRRSSCR